MATREQHLRYGKSLGLWKNKGKGLEPSVDGNIERIKAQLAEREAEEFRRSNASLQEESYVSETLLASQEAQRTPPTYPQGKSIAQIYGIPSSGASAYSFAEPEWNDSLQNDLKTYLEGRHEQVCIFSVDDAAKCALNLWHQKDEEGETLGKNVLSTLKEIHSKVDLGIGFVAAYKVSKALGGLGVTVKQFVDSKGVERVIISSLWNDSKMYYAVVNGLNVKKNHPYRITNPTIKQVGILAEDTINGFKKGAVLSLIISATINTNELVFNDDYHLVDWFGSMGSDLFKVIVSLSISAFAVSMAALLGLTVPIVVGFVIYAAIDIGIGFLWDRFKVEDKTVSLMKSKLDA